MQERGSLLYLVTWSVIAGREWSGPRRFWHSSWHCVHIWHSMERNKHATDEVHSWISLTWIVTAKCGPNLRILHSKVYGKGRVNCHVVHFWDMPAQKRVASWKEITSDLVCCCQRVSCHRGAAYALSASHASIQTAPVSAYLHHALGQRCVSHCLRQTTEPPSSVSRKQSWHISCLTWFVWKSFFWQAISFWCMLHGHEKHGILDSCNWRGHCWQKSGDGVHSQAKRHFLDALIISFVSMCGELRQGEAKEWEEGK